MTSHYKLSLTAAIIINLNIMLSTGIFLNSIPLSKYAGGLSFVPYIIIGILLIPLIIAIAILVNHHDEGTLYDISQREVGSTLGFISSWTYFIAKPASASLMIHFFNYLISQLFPILQQFSIFRLDLIIIFLFILLNLLNMKIGRTIQFSFLSIKTVPIAFIILSGLWFFQSHNFAPAHLNITGIPMGLPLALFACSGFEATLSLSRHIKNAKRNAPLAIIFSYLLAILLYILYQFGYFAAINIGQLASIESFNGIAFFIQSICKRTHIHLQALLYICMGISALGGAYSILFSNKWNLYTLAKRNHTFFSKTLIMKNNAGIAYWCLFIEAIICVLYLTLTNANQIMMQQMSAFGSTIAYSISILAFTVFAFNTIKKTWARLLAIFALINCTIFLIACINGFINHGPYALYAFIGIIIIGLGMYKLKSKSPS